MKRLPAILALLAVLFAGCQSKTKQSDGTVANSEKTCCDTVSNKVCCNKENVTNNQSQIVYFHNERRCATCMAVEEVTKEVIAQYDSSAIIFYSYQIDDEECADLVTKFQISGQTLLLCGKDTTINLTNDAFMYARVDPEKFKEILTAALKSVI